VSRPFCKLFGPPDDQVLAMLDTDRDGAPRVRVIFQDAAGGMVSATSVFDHNTSGALAARLHFDALNETSARHVAVRTLQEITT
jgi:hypothetical protein